MKTIIKSALALVAILTVYYAGCNGGDYVSTAQFSKAHQYLNRRIDTVIYKIDTVSVNVQQMRRQLNDLQTRISQMQSDLDSLKKGQILIYGAIKDLDQQPQQANSAFKARLQQLYDYLFQN